MSNLSKAIIWSIAAITFGSLIFILNTLGGLDFILNMRLPPTTSAQDQPLPKQVEEAKASLQPTKPTPTPFVVLPGKFVGKFSLGMSKKDVLKMAPKPQENSSDRLVYKSPKTGNSLIAHFQKNRLVQIDFTSKDFSTGEGIHTGNFRDAQYAALFDVQALPGTTLQLKYTLKTGGLIFYGNPDALSRTVGVVHAGQQLVVYTVQPTQTTAPVRAAQQATETYHAEQQAKAAYQHYERTTPSNSTSMERCRAAYNAASAIARSEQLAEYGSVRYPLPQSQQEYCRVHGHEF